jgi:hypothetical protein
MPGDRRETGSGVFPGAKPGPNAAGQRGRDPPKGNPGTVPDPPTKTGPRSGPGADGSGKEPDRLGDGGNF